MVRVLAAADPFGSPRTASVGPVAPSDGKGVSLNRGGCAVQASSSAARLSAQNPQNFRPVLLLTESSGALSLPTLGQARVTGQPALGSEGPSMLNQIVSAREIRRIVLQQSKRANVGHIGSSLCIAEIIAALYSRVLRIDGGNARDRFILSKGHAALALYAALALRGMLSREDLATYCGDDSSLGMHPEHIVPGVDFSTGSLGQGLSLAVGASLAARLQGASRRVFCLISDAECNEGAVWEAAMFAAHQRLSQLTAIIDLNGQQAFGLTSEVLDQSNLAERWSTFGWEVVNADGHDINALEQVLNAAPAARVPRVVLARTIFGKGVSFMERGTSLRWPNLPLHTINWHYLPMSDEEFNQAISEVEGNP